MNYPQGKEGSKAIELLPILIVGLVAFAVFSNALPNSFVYDDSAQVEKNPWIRDIRYLPDMFTSSVWSFESGPVTSNYYRPMMNVMFMITYHIFGLKAWGFHLVNVLFHAGNSILVFIIAARLLGQGINQYEAGSMQPSSRFAIHGSRFSAFISAILFAVHPIHVESVAWVSALPELSFSLFCMLSLLFYMRGDAGLGRDYLFSVLFFFIAVFFKETALILPALLLAYDFAYRKDCRFSKLWKGYIPYVVIALGYLAIRIYALGSFAPAKRFTNLSIFEYIINIFPLFGQYIEKLLFPVNLNAFYVFRPVNSLFAPKFIFGFAVTAAFMFLVWLSWKRSAAAFFSAIILAVPLLPVLYIPNLGENAFTERYAYLPSFGFLLLIALFLDLLGRRKAELSPVILLVTVCLTGVYSYQTVMRNTVWRNPFVFFTDMAQKSPDSAMAQSSLGLILFQQDRADEAITHYTEAIRLDPSYAGSYNNLGVIYMDKGWTDKAIQMFKASLQISPDNAEAMTGLGLAYQKMGFLDKAIEQYTKAIRLRPNFAEAYNNLGLAYAEAGLTDRAIEQYRIALRLNPEYAEAHGNLGTAYVKKKLLDLAIVEFGKMVALNPERADAHYNLGLALFDKGLPDRAVAEFQIAIRLRPGDARIYNILGAAYAELGLMDKAVENFRTSVSLAPSEPDYQKNLDRAISMINSAARSGK